MASEVQSQALALDQVEGLATRFARYRADGSVSTEFSPSASGTDASWKLAPEDVARTITDLLRYPDRALPSQIEIRPTRPPSR